MNSRFYLWIIFLSLIVIACNYYGKLNLERKSAEQRQDLKRMMELLLEKDGKK